MQSWTDGPAKAAILEFVEQTVSRGVPLEERVATFDADGTLWCEKPMPVELDFILRRLAQMAKSDSALRHRQPWKAAYEQDDAWLTQTIVEHYAGDDAKAREFLAGIGAAFAGMDVEAFEQQAGSFLRSVEHPRFNRGYLRTAYVPMVELLSYLGSNGFTNYIVSGSGADFMRSISEELFGIPPERVIGSEATLTYSGDETGGKITNQGKVGVLDDGQQKPVQIWTHIGRRPLMAVGNSNGDIPMLDFAQREGKQSLRLLVLHDDADREFAYTAGAEDALAKAGSEGWTVVSMMDDFGTVFSQEA